jgi:hypothetical protein
VVRDTPAEINVMRFCSRDEDSLWRCCKWFNHGSIACDFCSRNPAGECFEGEDQDQGPLVDTVLATEPAQVEAPDDDQIPF